MAVPAHLAVPVGPVSSVGLDTPITVKVLYNGVNRRFKLPLRDLGARSFPQKVWFPPSRQQMIPLSPPY
jgi:hypothetical protein